MSSNVYNDAHRSILAYLNNFIARNPSLNGFKTFDFDSDASIHKLPNNDIIGISDYAIENQTDMYVVTCVIGVCTEADDNNIRRLRNAVGLLFGELVPGATGEKFSIVDSNGIKRGYMTIGDNVQVMPVGRTETRPFQGISVMIFIGYKELPS